MKAFRTIALVSALCLTLTGTVSVFPAAAADVPTEISSIARGACGTGTEWELREDDRLTITGSGEIIDYSDPEKGRETAAPWGTDLRSVKIGEGVTRIGSNAFAGNTALRSISLPDSLTEIGDYAFRAASFENLTLSANVTKLGTGVFKECRPDTLTILNPTLPLSTESLGFAANDFFGLPTICGYEGSTAQTFAMENGYPFRFIGDPAGDNVCGQNLRWTLDEATGTLTISGSGKMYNYFASFTDKVPYEFEYAVRRDEADVPEPAPWSKSSVKKIVIGEGVKEIGNFAFYDCKDLESVSLPSTLDWIGSFAFCKSGLKRISFPARIGIFGSFAFYGCDKLEEIAFTGDSSYLGACCFGNCTALKSIHLPSALSTVEDYAFMGCTQLSDIYVPYSLTEFSKFAFEDTPWYAELKKQPFVIINDILTDCGTVNSGTVELPAGIKQMANCAFEGYDKITSVVIPDGYELISVCAFDNCKGLETITIPESVSSICDGAFENCVKLREINLPKKLISIGWDAFRGCSALKSVVLPYDLVSLGDDAFSECSSLTELTLLGRADVVRSYANPFAMNCPALKRVTIVNPIAEFSDKFVLFSNQGESYTGTLCGRKGSTTEDYAKKMGYRFEALEDVNPSLIPPENACGENALWTLDENGTLTISGTGDMGNYYRGPYFTSSTVAPQEEKSPACPAPWGDQIKKVVIEDGITSIGSGAFLNCKLLESVEMADSVTKIGSNAFDNCTGLESVQLSEHITEIGTSAFQNTAFRELTLPKDLKRIAQSAFQSSNNLKAIVIPEGTESIDSEAFRYCRSLAAVTLPDSLTNVGNNAFDSTKWLDSKTDTFVIENGILLKTNTDQISKSLRDGSLTEFTFPEGIRVIGGGALNRAFYDSGYLYSSTNPALTVKLPEGITHINEFAFCWNTGIAKVEMPSTLKEIGNSAFFDSFCIREVVFNEGLETIGSSAFGNSEMLTDITLPKTLRSIDYEAFGGCENLLSVTLLNPETEIFDAPNTFANPKELFDYNSYTGVIRGYENSTAEKYAQRFDRRFEAIRSDAPASKGRGDITCDNSIDVSDAVLLARFLNADSEAGITDQGLANADCNKDGKTDGTDLTDLLRYIAKKITF